VKYAFLLATAVSVAKREGNLRKHSSTTAVNTGANDDAREYQRFASPSSVCGSRTAESSIQRKLYNDFYLYLGFTYTDDETASDALCVFCNKVLDCV
jgi:hypothetical protein